MIFINVRIFKRLKNIKDFSRAVQEAVLEIHLSNSSQEKMNLCVTPQTPHSITIP